MGSWLLVSSPENFERSRGIGFRTSAMKSRHRRKWERVRPGDRVFYYVTGEKAIGGIARVTGEPNCRIARGVDSDRFLRLFLDRLCLAS